MSEQAVNALLSRIKNNDLFRYVLSKDYIHLRVPYHGSAGDLGANIMHIL